MSNNKDGQTLASLDKASLLAAFREALPQIIEELGDLVERRPPRLTRKDQQGLLEELSFGIDVSMPPLMALEALNGDIAKAKEAYRILEEWLRMLFQREGTRLRPHEDSLDYLLRKQFEGLKMPAPIRRLKQYRVVRQGLEGLIVAVLNSPGGEISARQLIEDFHQKHGKEQVRHFNSLKTRAAHYQNIKPRRMTSALVTRLADEYRDTSAAFEKRLRLLVGLNFIARGNPKKWEDLRRFGYNGLLQAVDSSDNPLLHFLKDVIDRHVRNALMHGEPSFSPSKAVVRFVDYAPTKRVERTVAWTMHKFYRKTKDLTLAMLTVAQLEMLFLYIRSYWTLRYLREV